MKWQLELLPDMPAEPADLAELEPTVPLFMDNAPFGRQQYNPEVAPLRVFAHEIVERVEQSVRVALDAGYRLGQEAGVYVEEWRQKDPIISISWPLPTAMRRDRIIGRPYERGKRLTPADRIPQAAADSANSRPAFPSPLTICEENPIPRGLSSGPPRTTIVHGPRQGGTLPPRRHNHWRDKLKLVLIQQK
jgi:hypothetical protein